jgi:16S rRNA (cytosine1402-N4)-methyltransferase
MIEGYHTSVLLHESVDALDIKPNGVYVDLTFGGGGHSREIIKRLGPDGKLFGFDQDEDAYKNTIEDDRFIFIHENFQNIRKFLRVEGVDKIDGVLADLGVSSYQFDTAEKGFSYRFEADLDMRMDIRDSLTASEILNTYSEDGLKMMFEKYGEVRNAKSLAKAIIDYRNINKITSVQEFNSVLEPLSFGQMYSYAAPVYQALRIEVNDEMGVLERMMNEVVDLLNPAGRFAVITFHSLEDRMVKNFFKEGKIEGEAVKDVFGNTSVPMKMVNKKPIIASDEELKNNKRSRSAKLRIAEKK